MGIYLWFRCFLSIFDFDSDLDLISYPNQSRDSYILIKLDTLSIREGFFCQWELVLPFTKLAISLWFRCFLQINDFDSDSRPHFRSESVQRFIYSNKIGYFVHKIRVSKVQWELVLPFTKMGISLCIAFYTIRQW